MAHSKRILVPERMIFLTARLEDRGSDLLIRELDLLRNSVRACMSRRPFQIDTAVILPDHLHMIWQMPDGDEKYISRWRQIQSTFARHLPFAKTGESGTGRPRVWQRRIWSQPIANASEWQRLRDYAFDAPVRAGLVPRAEDWQARSGRDEAPAKSRALSGEASAA